MQCMTISMKLRLFAPIPSQQTKKDLCERDYVCMLVLMKRIVQMAAMDFAKGLYTK